MESDPEQFADGIRGKVLWHNEYRTQTMYTGGASKASGHVPRQDVRRSPSTPSDGSGALPQQHLRRVPRA